MWNVLLYLIPIATGIGNCLFQQKKKATKMLNQTVDVHDFHFWNNKYNYPEE